MAIEFRIRDAVAEAIDGTAFRRNQVAKRSWLKQTIEPLTEAEAYAPQFDHFLEACDAATRPIVEVALKHIDRKDFVGVAAKELGLKRSDLKLLLSEQFGDRKQMATMIYDLDLPRANK